jgi:hypothetical protein
MAGRHVRLPACFLLIAAPSVARRRPSVNTRTASDNVGLTPWPRRFDEIMAKKPAPETPASKPPGEAPGVAAGDTTQAPATETRAVEQPPVAVPVPDVLARLRAALTDRYAIEHELGRGGMGTVYLAQDLRHRRPVAIKILNPELARSLGADRFLREIEVTAHLNHPVPGEFLVPIVGRRPATRRGRRR